VNLPPAAKRYFAEKRLDAAYKHQAAIEENRFVEGQENRRAFERFYNNLTLFSGGTIALSITYLGYLKSLGKEPVQQRLLIGSWISLFVCLLCSLLYVLINLYYSHHFREREWAEAKKRKFEAERDEMPNMDIVNLQAPDDLVAFQTARTNAAEECDRVAGHHKKKQDRYHVLWVSSGRIARLGFALGIGLLLWFAIVNA
jgi:hypothetical protein